MATRTTNATAAVAPHHSIARPRYRLTQIAYIDDKLLDPEAMPIDPNTDERKPLIIEFDGPPGPHMEPINDAAQRQVEEYFPNGMKFHDPITAMTQVTDQGAAQSVLMELFAKALGQQLPALAAV